MRREVPSQIGAGKTSVSAVWNSGRSVNENGRTPRRLLSSMMAHACDPGRLRQEDHHEFKASRGYRTKTLSPM